MRKSDDDDDDDDDDGESWLELMHFSLWTVLGLRRPAGTTLASWHAR